MQLTIAQFTLADALRAVRPLAEERSVIPITAAVVLAAGEGTLELRATDLQSAIRLTLPAQVDEPGEVAIPGRVLADLVTHFEAGAVVITAEPGWKARLVCGTSEATLAVMDPADHPPIPAAGELLFSVPSRALSEALAVVLPAASKTADRPVLQAVHFTAKDEALTLAAADGFQLAICRTLLAEPVEEERTLLLPADALKQLRALLVSEEVVSIHRAGNGGVAVTMEHRDGVRCVFTAQEQQGQFPNYPQLVPKQSSTSFTVSADRLLRLVRLVGVLAARDGDSQRIRLQVFTPESGAVLRLSSAEEQLGDQQAEMALDGPVEPAKVCLHAGYLVNALSAVGISTVTIGINSPSQPVLFTANGGDLRTVIMPIYDNWASAAGE